MHKNINQNVYVEREEQFWKNIMINCFGFLTWQWQLYFTALEVKEGEAMASKQ